MNQYDQHHHSAAYPQAPTSYPPPAAAANRYDVGPYVTAPPPMGYPTKDGASQEHNGRVETKSRGFAKGCLAGLCCCWCLDCCF